MSHTFIKSHFHVVFSTKERRKIISEETQPHLFSYIAGICRNQKMISVAIGGVEDHVHMFFHLPPTLALAKAISLVKANSSKWMNEHGRNFAWQEGYSAFSVSASNLERVALYIRNQKAHHKKMSFEDEYLELLRKHKIQFDPKYVSGSVAPTGLLFDKRLPSAHALGYILSRLRRSLVMFVSSLADPNISLSPNLLCIYNRLNPLGAPCPFP